jgi:hypothetical protein
VIGLAVVAFALLLVGYVSHAFTGWIRIVAPSFDEYDAIVSDQTDWNELRDVLQSRGMLDQNRYFVLAGRYEFCFKTQLVLNNALPVACLTDNPIYQVLAHDDAALLGRDAIIVADWWNAPQPIDEVMAKFESFEALPPIWMTLHGRPTRQVHLVIARNLKQPLFDVARR